MISSPPHLLGLLLSLLSAQYPGHDRTLFISTPDTVIESDPSVCHVTFTLSRRDDKQRCFGLRSDSFPLDWRTASSDTRVLRVLEWTLLARKADLEDLLELHGGPEYLKVFG